MAKIYKTAFYLPEKVVTNQDFVEQFNDDTLLETGRKIGITERHVVDVNTTSVDLAEKAAMELLDDFDKSKIDFLLFCTQTPDYFLPTSACVLQNRLGLPNIPALDFNLGCSGFIYGLAMAQSFIESAIAKNVLLLTGETYSKFLHKNDKANRLIFGDAGSATIIQSGKGIGEFELGSDGSGADKLIVKNGGFRNSFDTNAKEKSYGNQNIYTDNHFFMNGPDIFNFTIRTIPKTVKNTLIKNELEMQDIDLFIFHQANEYMLNHLQRRLKIPKEKFYLSLEKYGNTVSATIPICLKNAFNENKIEPGMKVMLVGFGVGLSWGATVVKF